MFVLTVNYGSKNNSGTSLLKYRVLGIFRKVLSLHKINLSTMGVISVFILAIGLSMDSLAVSIASGMSMKTMRETEALKVSMFLALFQGTMPVIGWAVGNSFSKYITAFDHWIAFVMLLFLGGKMIIDGVRNNDDCQAIDPTKTSTLIGLSLATSIDALAVGVSIALLKHEILFPAVIIGLVTLVFSLIGLYAGKMLGKLVKQWVTIAGGVVLVFIGTKILIEHTIL